MRNRTEATDMRTQITNESWARANQTNRLQLMVKDPATLFAYWEVDGIHKKLVSEHFQSEWAQLPFYLQVYDVTDILFDGCNAHACQRIGVHPDCDSWYVTGLQPGRSYLADFGTTTWQGQFFPILRSNAVQTPLYANELGPDPIVRFEALATATGSLLTLTRKLHDEELWVRESDAKPEDWRERFDGYHLAGHIRGDA